MVVKIYKTYQKTDDEGLFFHMIIIHFLHVEDRSIDSNYEYVDILVIRVVFKGEMYL